MTVTHVGSTKKYSAGWEGIFRGKKAAKTDQPAAKKKSAAKKKPKR